MNLYSLLTTRLMHDWRTHVRDGNEPSTSSHFHEISSASRAEHGFLDSSTSRAINSRARARTSSRTLCSARLVLVRAVNLMLGSAREIQSFARTCSARLEMLVACGLVAYKTFLRALVCAFCMLHAESLFLWGERFMVQMRRIGPILICLFEKASLGLI